MNIKGNQVDAWSVLALGRAKDSEAIKGKLIKRMKAKKLPGLEIREVLLSFTDSLYVGGATKSLEYVLFRQTLDDGARAKMAVRVAPYGSEDLELTWRLFERNTTTEFRRYLISNILFAIAIFFAFSIFENGVFVKTFGLAITVGCGFLGLWLRSEATTKMKLEGQTSTHQRIETRNLRALVDNELMQALNDLGIDRSEMRVQRASQEEGVGKLRGPE